MKPWKKAIRELRSAIGDSLLLKVAMLYPRNSIERKELLEFADGFYKRRISEQL